MLPRVVTIPSAISERVIYLRLLSPPRTYGTDVCLSHVPVFSPIGILIRGIRTTRGQNGFDPVSSSTFLIVLFLASARNPLKQRRYLSLGPDKAEVASPVFCTQR